MEEPAATAIQCLMCEPMEKYLSAAEGYTEALTGVLQAPMWLIFLSVVVIWIMCHALKMAIGKGDLGGFSHEFFYVAIAAGLMSGNGFILVNGIYNTSLATMGGAAAAVLQAAASAGGETNELIGQAAADWSGMTQLVYVAELGFRGVLHMSIAVWSEFSLGNLMAGVYGVMMALPWLLLIIVYFSQIAVSVFRVMMLAGLSPYIMLGMGFGWGRGMVQQGFKSLLAAYMVLFGASMAVGLVLYAIAVLNVSSITDPSGDLQDAEILVPIVLGWMGFAFVTEATGMANSITQSQFTNSAVAAMTGGIMATGAAAYQKMTKGGGLRAAGNVLSAAGQGFQAGQAFMGDPKGSMKAFGDRLDAHRQRISDRMSKPIIDKGK